MDNSSKMIFAKHAGAAESPEAMGKDIVCTFLLIFINFTGNLT